MSEPTAGIDPERLRRIDAVCIAFEKEWRAGGRPAAEEWLPRVEPEARTELLRELLRLEVHYRRKRGEVPTAGEYHARFPEHPDLVAALFRTSGTDETVLLTDTGSNGGAEPAGREAWPAIPGYEILAYLGGGGMGKVYKARDLKLDRVVALKMIRDDQTTPKRVGQFLVEARATARLRHPHIVHIQKIGEHDGLPYLELEYVGGGDLAKKLGGCPLPPREAARLVEVLARAVHYAHKSNIVHRDLKPANVLLTESGEPKIADFGLATLADPNSGTAAGASAGGTLPYMAPEQAAGNSVGPPADVYALGVILFELLTGRRPFAAGSPAALLERVKNEPPPSPRSVNRAVPRSLEAICLKCLEKNPADRYPTATALADALEHATRGPAGRVWRWCRRNPVASAGSLAILTAVAFSVVSLLTADDSLRRVRRSGELRVGLDPNCPPYAYKENGRLTGLDVELSHKLAEKLGATARHVEFFWDWPGLTQRLEERTIDVILSATTITEERKRDVAFVEYARDPLVFVVRDGSKIGSRQDMAGTVIAVQDGTSAQAAAERLRREGVSFKEIKNPRATPEPFAYVVGREADVALDHRLIARHHARKWGLKVLSDPAFEELNPEPLGLAVRKDARELRAALQDALDALKADGTYARLMNEWANR